MFYDARFYAIVVVPSILAGMLIGFSYLLWVWYKRGGGSEYKNKTKAVLVLSLSLLLGACLTSAPVGHI